MMVNSSTNVTLQEDHRDDTEEKFMKLIERVNTISYFYIMPVLLTTGISTNAVNIHILRKLRNDKDKKLANSAATYMHLCWLAVAQLLSCVSIVPSLIHLYRESLSYLWAYYYAHIEILFINSLTSTCVYIIVGLSVDRYVAVCRPHSYQTLKGVSLATTRIACCFLIPPLFYIPLCFFQTVQQNNETLSYTPKENTKITDNVFWQYWNVTVEICHRLLPCLIIVTLNICIIINFKNIKQNVNKKQNKDGQESKSAQEMKLFILLMSVIIVFLITTIPAAILGLTDTFGHQFFSVNFEVRAQNFH